MLLFHKVIDNTNSAFHISGTQKSET